MVNHKTRIHKLKRKILSISFIFPLVIVRTRGNLLSTEIQRHDTFPSWVIIEEGVHI